MYSINHLQLIWKESPKLRIKFTIKGFRVYEISSQGFHLLRENKIKKISERVYKILFIFFPSAV